MDMVAVGLERVTTLADAMYRHTEHIERRHQQGTDGHDDMVGGVHPFGTRQTDTQGEEADDVTQGETARVAHEQLMSAFLVPEHVIEPERHHHT